MRLAERHDMVEALTPDRADEAFNMAILPRRVGAMGRPRMPIAWSLRVTTMP